MTEDNGGHFFAPITGAWLVPETDDDDEGWNIKIENEKQ